MNICVHTSPGRRGEEEPHVFFVGGRRLLIEAILDRWTSDRHRYFEVRCDDGRRFLLRFDGERRGWELAGVYAATLRPPKSKAPKAVATSALQPRRWWSAFLRA